MREMRTHLTIAIWIDTMHSDINQEILAQFETAFNRIETSGVTGYESIKPKVAEFLGYCSSGTMPLVLLQQKIVAIKKELQPIDAMSNHGYLYLAYETAKKNLEGATKKRVEGDNIDPERVSLISTLQGKAKIQEATKEPETVPVSIFDIIESYDLSSIPTDLKDDQTSTISRKSRSIIKSLAENVDKVDFERAVVRMAKRIRSVLNEVQIANDIGKYNRFSHWGLYEKGMSGIKQHGHSDLILPNQTPTHLGKIGDLNVSLVNAVSHVKDGNHHGYVMSHDDEGNIHHVLNVTKPFGFANDTLVTKLASNNPSIKSPIKMHDVYHHLVKNGLTLMSDANQSHGGIHIWKSLAQKPDVNVYGWDLKNDRPINTDEHLHDISDTHTDYEQYSADPVDKELESHILKHHRLIATKKDLTEEKLNEIYLLDYDKSQKFEDNPFYGHSTINDAREYQGHFAKETDLGNVGPLHISQFEEQTRNGPRGRIMTHDDDGRIHHVLTYVKPYENSPNTIKVRSITANDKHKVVGAHELYHHLLNQGTTIESGEDMTMGGLKVWHKLASMPGVKTHGWDGQRNIPIHTDSILNPTKDIPEHAVLIAHK